MFPLMKIFSTILLEIGAKAMSKNMLNIEKHFIELLPLFLIIIKIIGKEINIKGKVAALIKVDKPKNKPAKYIYFFEFDERQYFNKKNKLKVKRKRNESNSNKSKMKQ